MRSLSYFFFALVSVALPACGSGDLLSPYGPELEADAIGTHFGSAEQCREGNCKCYVTLAQVMNGEPYNPDWLYGSLGSSNPADIFMRGGSENIPVTCRTAKYWVDHDPAWLEGYFDVQLAAGNPYVFGGELFSSVYTALVVGNSIATLKHAMDRGHQPLVNKASAWLKMYWASLALASVNKRLTRVEGYNKHGDPMVVGADSRGFNPGIVGTRAYVNGYGGAPMVTGSGSQYALLSMALEHGGRHYGANLTNSPGYYGGIRAAVEAVGYRLDSNGKVNLQSRSVAPKFFGLTATERNHLTEFINTEGRRSWQEVFGMLATTELACPMTIYRTVGGVMTWWGDSENRTDMCNNRKGGSWAAAKITNGGVAYYMSRSQEKYGRGGGGQVWREGSKICAQGDMPKRCIPLPEGEFVHEIKLRRRQPGVVCVAGNCAGSVEEPPEDPPNDPPNDPPPTGPSNATFCGQSVPTEVAPGQQFSATICMSNTGGTTWTRDAGFTLGSQRPMDNQRWGRGRVQLPAGATVAPGQNHSFSAALTAPSAPGTYDFQWRMLQEQVEWFGGLTQNLSIAVVAQTLPPGGGGESVYVELGPTDRAEGLSRPPVEPADGQTTSETVVNQCNGNSIQLRRTVGDSRYVYFRVDDAFIFNGSHPRVEVNVHHWNRGGGTLKLQYHGPSGNYQLADSIAVGDDRCMRFATFIVDDAIFGNGEHKNSDFRLVTGNTDPQRVRINRVTVTKR